MLSLNGAYIGYRNPVMSSIWLLLDSSIWQYFLWTETIVLKPSSFTHNEKIHSNFRQSIVVELRLTSLFAVEQHRKQDWPLILNSYYIASSSGGSRICTPTGKRHVKSSSNKSSSSASSWWKYIHVLERKSLECQIHPQISSKNSLVLAFIVIHSSILWVDIVHLYMEFL